MKIFLMVTLLVSVSASAATHRMFADGSGSGSNLQSAYESAVDEASDSLLNRCERDAPSLRDMELSPKPATVSNGVYDEKGMLRACKNTSNSDAPFYVCFMSAEITCTPKGTK